MKAEILFNEIGLINDKFIIEADAANFKVKSARRAWLSRLSVASVLVICLIAINTIFFRPQENEIIKDYRSILYFINEEISSNLKSPDCTGGVDYLTYTYPLDLDFLFIESRLTDYVGEGEFREWTHEEAANGNYLYVNVLTYIERFNITKDQFIEACNIYPEYPLYGDDLYEVADVLFSGDIERILRYTKSAGAVYSNGKLFSAEWLDTHTTEDYFAEGIEIEEIENAEEATLSAIRGFSKNPENQYKEKIAEYKAR
jgi:hypothetical protein